MKNKILNLLLIVSSLIGYLEWGQNQASFLFQAEYEVIRSLFTSVNSIAHPFILIPLLGQVLLVVTLFQKEPSKILTYIGIACLGLLLGLMLFIGISVFNFKILISTIPFFVLATIAIRNHRQK